MATTADLMHRQGVAATTLDQVVDICGVSKSQLYHYFPDKEVLVAEVIAAQANRVLSAHKQLLEQVSSMPALEKWRDALVANLGEAGYRCPVGSLANELAGRSDSARRTLSGAFGTWTGELASAFVRLQESGELHSEAAAEDLALEVVAALQGGYLLAETMQDEQPFVLALDMALGWVKAHAWEDR
ncbi:TetR/AcrR family transcriptional regulator [Microbispora corallina]|uniref:Transcriptional regulator, TetR family protein n=1 Tax=Microbispora corallina TaxID=83302 RepID=A0ABQ4G7R4_9ACTN|nr:TetR/AcrR family transcriptional regulator [Microbispora corallina]GIH43112.1 putative transcriptional regulator, TetR family protein [Microbispora corallina]